MSLSMNMDLLGRMSMESPMPQMDMPNETMSQMSGEGDMAPKKGMNSDENMNPGLVMSEDKQMAAMPSICLLYTSPSPRDRQKSRMPSSA